MDGKELEKKIRETGMTKRDIASKIGISEQGLNSRLNAEDVKTGFVEELSRATGRDLSWWYGYNYSTISGSIIASGDGSSVHADASQFLELLSERRKTIEDLQRAIAESQRTIDAQQRTIAELQRRIDQLTDENIRYGSRIDKLLSILDKQ